MKKLGIFLISIVLGSFIKAQESAKKDELYIQTYAKIAVEEMQRYHIPASITLAQGILETGNGQSRLAQIGNNHFGIKCKNDWSGGRMYHDDDERGECFRKYKSAKESYRDHSLFLTERPYYKKLFQLDRKDYKAWAHGLKKAGYATNPRYAYMLINLIERYKLYQFDLLTIDEVDVKLAELFPNTFKSSDFENLKESTVLLADDNIKALKVDVSKKPTSVKITAKKVGDEKKIVTAKANNFIFPSSRIKIHPNGNVRYIIFKNGDTLEDISKAYHISLNQLKSYNDLIFQDSIVINQKIYLDPKKKKGLNKEHIVKEGEKMYDIAQENGISLIELYKRKLMFPGDEPKKGDRILLKGRKS
jgi:LysM repeat protein